MTSPPTPAALQILLALADRELHGYGILQDVEKRTEGRMRLSPGTLYSNLRKMVEAGWIVEVESSELPTDDSRRRVYRLSGDGRVAAEAELARLETLLRQGRSFGLVPRDA